MAHPQAEIQMVKVKNKSQQQVIEPYFGVVLEASETKELPDEIATRLLGLRPDVIEVVVESQEQPKSEEFIVSGEVVFEEAPKRRGRPKKSESVEVETSNEVAIEE